MSNNIVRQVANKIEGKRKFVVHSRETVYYRTVVWAENAEQAEQMVWDGEVPVDKPVGSDDFDTISVEEGKD